MAEQAVVRGLLIGLLVGLLLGTSGAQATLQTEAPRRLVVEAPSPVKTLQELAVQVRWMQQRLLELERECAP